MSQFGAEKFTTRSRAAIEAAQLAATTAGNTATEPIHLLVALLKDADGTAGTLVTKAGVDPRTLTAQAEAVQAALPRASGTTVQQPGASSALTRVLAKALELASSMQDDYVASEHLLIAIAAVESPAQKVLTDAGLTEAGLREGLTAVRGNRRVTSQDAESTYEALEKYSVDLTAGRRGRSARPGHRPRRGDPPRGPGALAGAPRTTRCSSASPASARPPSSKGSPSGSSPATSPTRSRAAACCRSTWPRWWPARSTAASSRSGSRPSSRRSRTPVGRSSPSSTSCTPSWVPAPGGDSAMDAGNMLKPMLARGELHMIGATTLDEYRERIEKDPALERRFQQVFVGEPSVEDTIQILRGIQEKYEAHHGVRITDAALVAAATLSDRYITGRRLPDKAIDLIDEAASRLRMEIESSPEEIDQLRRQVDRLKMEEFALEKETDDASKERLEALQKELADREEELRALDARWEQEKTSLEGEGELRRQLDQLRTEADKYLRERRCRQPREGQRDPLRPDPRRSRSRSRPPSATTSPTASRWSARRSAPSRSPTSSRPGPASRPAGCSRARPPSCCGWRRSSASG